MLYDHFGNTKSFKNAIQQAQASDGQTVNYSLGATNQVFYIDSSSGEIRTQVAITRPTRQTFSVTAVSADGQTASAVVNVIIVC